MANSSQIIPEKIHLNQIKWVKENTLLLEEKLPKKPTYDFVIAHNMMHNLDKQIVKIRLFVDMSGNVDGKTINQGGNYEVDFLFKIDDLENHYQMIDEKPVFNGVFVSTLLGISYSSLRGMLFSIWSNTPLKDVVLPVISVPLLLNSKR